MVKKRRSKNCNLVTWSGHILYFLTALFFHISIRIFYTLFICLVFDGLLKLIYFRMFCSKHSITFENMYLLSCWFHCVDIFYIKFRFCETYIATSSVTRNVLIETLSNFRTTKCWFTRYLDIHVLGLCKFKCYHDYFLHFTFHWYFHGSN